MRRRYEHNRYNLLLKASDLSDNLIPHLIRFIVCGFHPDNEMLRSNLIPRWILIGWLLKCCRTPLSISHSKLALMYDFLYYEPETDNIMNIEPCVLLLVRSIPKYVEISSSLVDFVFSQIDMFESPQMKKRIYQGIQNALTTCLRKGVVQSLTPLLQCDQFELALKSKITAPNSPFAAFLEKMSATSSTVTTSASNASAGTTSDYSSHPSSTNATLTPPPQSISPRPARIPVPIASTSPSQLPGNSKKVAHGHELFTTNEMDVSMTKTTATSTQHYSPLTTATTTTTSTTTTTTSTLTELPSPIKNLAHELASQDVNSVQSFILKEEPEETGGGGGGVEGGGGGGGGGDTDVDMNSSSGDYKVGGRSKQKRAPSISSTSTSTHDTISKNLKRPREDTKKQEHTEQIQKRRKVEGNGTDDDILGQWEAMNSATVVGAISSSSSSLLDPTQHTLVPLQQYSSGTNLNARQPLQLGESRSEKKSSLQLFGPSLRQFRMAVLGISPRSSTGMTMGSGSVDDNSTKRARDLLAAMMKTLIQQGCDVSESQYLEHQKTLKGIVIVT